MSNSINSVFSRMVITSPGAKSDPHKAAIGFTGIFATMLAKEMRKALVGDNGMGMGTGAGSDIYSAFFDEAMGKALAGSRSMKPLNDLLTRQLDASHAAQAAATGAIVRNPSADASVKSGRVFDAAFGSSGILATDFNSAFSAPDQLPGDNRGPILLPPPPATMAPILPKPSPLDS
jgi:Rod binding domain-containing protein